MPPSVLTMSLLGMKSAPELFRGDHSHIRNFLDHYERFCALHNVVDDQEKVHSILQYCSTKVQETIEGMIHYHIPDWDRLKHDLLKYFDTDLSDERFYERDLKNFVVNSMRCPIHSLIAFWSYNRDFICIGGWLRNQERISEDEFNRYFWAGLPSSFRHLINSHLLLLNPNLDVTHPFSYSEVTKAAEQLVKTEKGITNSFHNSLKISMSSIPMMVPEGCTSWSPFASAGSSVGNPLPESCKRKSRYASASWHI
ncbi:hypothetical protein SCLCIDRAFT_134240 [Scleroderma citrinum Foug A]|uniref:Uncharacterized protein n=1 Tax=Scleroderma citrinum Foug A TaxID=1036808 RepID=A0A0C3DHZ1_9AGAM|nr:hypothetical protein SCLCIDRAFT_134240 [Scleroderma citrinum Foug A]